MALFAALSESELQGLAQRAVERLFAPDEMLFWEGEACAGIFLIVQGSVKVFRTSPGGREVMLAIETAPATVAELPLFDGGRRDARREESASQYRSEKVKTNDVKEQIELDVRLALDGLQSAEDQVKVAREGLELAENELTQARRRYDAGVAISVEVTDAQTRLERARDNQTAALYSYNVARIDLAQATGAVRRRHCSGWAAATRSSTEMTKPRFLSCCSPWSWHLGPATR